MSVEPDKDGKKDEGIHIFVNRRRFDATHGVTKTMTGSAIAALVGVDPGNAIVRRESGPDKVEIGSDEEVSVKNGEHFLVTRKVVDAGAI